MLLGFLHFFALAFCAPAVPLTLEEAYKAALGRAEVAAISDEQLIQARERYAQARGSLFPSLSFNATYQRQDQGDTGSSATRAFGQVDQTTLRIVGRQPLFQGLREYAGLSQAKALTKASEADVNEARRLLFNELADAYYLTLSNSKEHENLTELVALAERRLEELRDRRRIGRTRVSEVLALTTQLKQLIAQKAAAEGQLAAARDTLSFYTGIEDPVPTDKAAAIEPLPPLGAYLKEGDARPDVKAAAFRVEAAESGIWVARGGHLPTLDISGNYYFKRPGVLQNVKWDFIVGFTLPLFQGGLISAQTAEAAAIARQARLTESRARRLVELEMRRSHDLLRALAQQIKALAESVNAAERNYETQNKEYRLGLVTNVEVIQALNSLTEARRAYDRARYQQKNEFVKLEAAAGRSPAAQALD